jgi:hypothetical protein
MAIEFRCTQCGKLLRTGDETAGKHAKCPQCGAVMTIPATGGAAPPPPVPPGGGTPFSGAGAQPAGTAGSANPYQSPAPFTPLGAGQAPGAITPTTLDLGDIFSRTWNIFKEQWGMCIVALLVVLVISFAVNFIVGCGFGIVGHAAKSQALQFFLSLIAHVATTLFGVWLGIGQAKYFLKVARGQTAEIGDLFSGGPLFVNVLLGSLLVGVIVLVGLLACVVPGVVLSLMFSQFYYLILDRNVPVLESLSQSRELTNGNKMTLFLIWLVATGLTVLACIPCFLGLIVVVPYLTLMVPVIYLAITGQPTADQLK